ncbi:MAG: MarR family transcriptional regulator [Acetobacteraceae bacterium]|nr:MarR family transcriptional regulator [Acetobacteraceae bacterium]
MSASAKGGPHADDAPIALQGFLPYRLAVLADHVSHSLAQIYTDRFDLTRQEWRVLAGLADRGPIVARDVAGHTTLDKMSVSRAVAGLEAKGYLSRHDDPQDRRNKILEMTPQGRALYVRIVPLARAREAYLLDSLSAEDRAALDRILTALLARSIELERRG